MLPSIRHLLKTDPATDQNSTIISSSIPSSSSPPPSHSNSAPTSPSSSSIPSSSSMPTTTAHTAQFASFHKQGGMVTTEELLSQHHYPQQQHQQQQQQYRPTHRHPDTPHESFSPPQADRRKYIGEPIAHIAFASKDRNRYHLSPTLQRPATSPSDGSPTKSPHSASLRHSPTGSYGLNEAGDKGMVAHRTVTDPENSAWSRAGPHNQDTRLTSPPTAVAFRPQPRISPADPSLSSSSSSASPSPSISTITAASTPMTTDGITAVTKGTAAASLSDSRPSRQQGAGKPVFLKEEPIDRYERPSDLAHSSIGGLVQPAVKRLSLGHRGSSQDSNPSAPRQPQQPPRRLSAYGPDGAMSLSSAKLERAHSPDNPVYPKEEHSFPPSAHHYDTARGPFAPYEQPYQPHPSGNIRNGVYPPSSTPSSSTSRSRHPDYEFRHLSGQYPPLSPKSLIKDDSLNREKTREWSQGEPHRDPRLKAETAPREQGYRDSSYSPPGPPYPYDAHPSSHNYPPYYPPHYPHYRQHYPPHHQPPHPSLQQQQQPPPLYDPVRESDQRTPHHSGAPSAMYPPYPEPHSPREAYYRSQRRGYASASGYPEAPSPSRQQASSQQQQQHGLVARPERLTSPGPSHPYHSSRSYHSHSADAAFAGHPSAQHRNRAEDDIRLARGSASHPLHSHDQRHHYPPLSPQPHSSRYPRDSTHARALTHGSPEHAFDGHGSLERMQGQGQDGGRDMTRTYDGRWDAESQYRMRRRRGDHETISEPQSSSLAAATAAASGAGTAVPHRREAQRGIRPSVSESDLASAELKRDRDRHLGGSLGVNPDVGDAGEYEGDAQHLDAEEREYRRMHAAAAASAAAAAAAGRHLRHLDDPRQHMSRDDWLYAEHQQLLRHHQQYPYHPDQYSQHPSYPHEYDPHYESQRLARGGAAPSSSPQRAQAGSSSLSLSADQQRKKLQRQQPQQPQQAQQQPPGDSAEPSSSSQSQAAAMPGSSFPLRMLPPLHPRQLPALLPYHTTRPGSTNSSQPKIPMRRGPYLSKQRALLAGYELPSPSSRYQCQYCSKRFSRPSSLRIHTYSHTGERPFKCSEEGCGRQFSVQSNMRRHLRVHRMGRMRSDYPELDQEQEQEQEQEQDQDQEHDEQDLE